MRAGYEMAVLDAVAHSANMPLWRLFGGHSDTVLTDITVGDFFHIESHCNYDLLPSAARAATICEISATPSWNN